MSNRNSWLSLGAFIGGFGAASIKFGSTTSGIIMVAVGVVIGFMNWETK